ncbi:TenA family transcriptional regulator [Phenylobacterium soli]|uniref:Biliverdin-producing heme oxygenase n=1 Tax=Phenylobacterium soli TaxID=2170551 RepID=A0A328AK01_9CAUL|nr:iron-containing redox enzyme family protein [Phenylobacterium soli]RAK54801.1 biliverdin-producing heme oxygenase [Phenylobacterium soli]
MSFFEVLARETAAERNLLFTVPQILDGLQGKISRETYVLYLAQAYHHVSHTVPLLRLAAREMDDSRARFRDALLEYVEEETGHEQWILRDIANAGGDAEAVRASGPAPQTAAMVAYAYDYVSHVNPMGLFGMIFVLEGTSIALATSGASAVAESLGLGPECFSYLTSHGSLDQQHMAFFAELMGQVDDAADQAAVIEVARNVFRLFADMFRAIPHERSIAHVA